MSSPGRAYASSCPSPAATSVSHSTTGGLIVASASPSWTARKEGDPKGSPSPGQPSSAGALGSLMSLDLSRNRNW